MREKLSKIYLDKVGICTSLLCMLHCLAVPILLILGLDSILIIIDHEWLELTIVLCSLSIGLIAFLQGFVQHRQHFVPVLFVAGFLLLINGESVAHECSAAGLSVAGASVIAYAHYDNFQLKKSIY
ncbi:MerC domain-containing protein [Fulvivirgaceae bacterium BMA10]|uniref:MerC domain-containing protein n=1 Tax=Splendidivirga corallicola TaxID=3051826 RepID=A0ABT8KRE5_9BACT|nr:MerC domain-containing protein [Fulvivirgaceae bacterium BMA10]